MSRRTSLKRPQELASPATRRKRAALRCIENSTISVDDAARAEGASRTGTYHQIKAWKSLGFHHSLREQPEVADAAKAALGIEKGEESSDAGKLMLPFDSTLEKSAIVTAYATEIVYNRNGNPNRASREICQLYGLSISPNGMRLRCKKMAKARSEARRARGTNRSSKQLRETTKAILRRQKPRGRPNKMPFEQGLIPPHL
eukprot:scaffold1683_cov140-Pinguiococcus_pyrenoidosus.AAC.1